MNATVTVDVAVVGAGIVGSAIARDLAGSHLRVALVEARDDVGDGTSKPNTAILHSGFDARPGTLESRLVARGHRLLSEYAARTGIPVERTGALLVARTDEEVAALPGLQDKAAANGYDACRLVTADEVYAAVPDLGVGVRGGLTVPDEAITCTWTTNLALATDAVRRGALLLRGHRVEAVRRGAEGTTPLVTGRGEVVARWVVNAAGLGGGCLRRRQPGPSRRHRGRCGARRPARRRRGPRAPRGIRRARADRPSHRGRAVPVGHAAAAHAGGGPGPGTCCCGATTTSGSPPFGRCRTGACSAAAAPSGRPPPAGSSASVPRSWPRRHPAVARWSSSWTAARRERPQRRGRDPGSTSRPRGVGRGSQLRPRGWCTRGDALVWSFLQQVQVPAGLTPAEFVIQRLSLRGCHPCKSERRVTASGAG